jgi:hypothetical protein
MVKVHGLTFKSEAQAKVYFSKNPIKSTPLLIFKSKQAGDKWLPTNMDLILKSAGETKVLKIKEGYEVSLKNGNSLYGGIKVLKIKEGYVVLLKDENSLYYLAERAEGRYYWSEADAFEGTDSNPEKMDVRVSVFNCHSNKADERAKVAFIDLFDQKLWDKKIQPFIDKGVMSIFDEKLNTHTQFYAWTIWLFVNGY